MHIYTMASEGIFTKEKSFGQIAGTYTVKYYFFNWKEYCYLLWKELYLRQTTSLQKSKSHLDPRNLHKSLPQQWNTCYMWPTDGMRFSYHDKKMLGKSLKMSHKNSKITKTFSEVSCIISTGAHETTSVFLKPTVRDTCMYVYVYIMYICMYMHIHTMYSDGISQKRDEQIHSQIF